MPQKKRQAKSSQNSQAWRHCQNDFDFSVTLWGFYRHPIVSITEGSKNDATFFCITNY